LEAQCLLKIRSKEQ